jgi:hypothetical protein
VAQRSPVQSRGTHLANPQQRSTGGHLASNDGIPSPGPCKCANLQHNNLDVAWSPASWILGNMNPSIPHTKMDPNSPALWYTLA